MEPLKFGVEFNHPIERVVWPVSLRQLKLGDFFDQTIAGVAGLLEKAIVWQRLQSGRRHNHVAGGADSAFIWHCRSLPSAKRRPYDVIFNQALDKTSWPTSLRQFSIGGNFQQSLEGLGAWMPNLEEMTVLQPDPPAYNTILDGIQWPKGLRKLTVFDDVVPGEIVIPQTAHVTYLVRGH